LVLPFFQGFLWSPSTQQTQELNRLDSNRSRKSEQIPQRIQCLHLSLFFLPFHIIPLCSPKDSWMFSPYCTSLIVLSINWNTLTSNRLKNSGQPLYSLFVWRLKGIIKIQAYYSEFFHFDLLVFRDDFDIIHLDDLLLLLVKRVLST